MAELATSLIRLVARSFYTTEHVLVVEALILHSTLPDIDLAAALGMQPKPLRKLCGKLREDGLISAQTRAEKRTDDAPSFYPSGQGKDNKPRERLTNRDWYYLNYHRAIDSIKWRMHKLNRHVESLGAPTTEKKDLRCPRCKAEYTELEAMDRLDDLTGEFACHRCGNTLVAVEEDERAVENEMMKRLNLQFAKLLDLLRQIDAATVPENEFETALSKQRPIIRGADNPGARTQVVDLPNRNMASTKGLEMKPEKVAVSLQDDETVKKQTEIEEARLQREKEAKQNALPEWISRSTIDGAMTVSGAKEERERLARQVHLGDTIEKDRIDSVKDEKKPAASGGDDDVMAAYWEELARAKQREAADAQAEDEEEEEEEDDEDEFEDVGGLSVNGNGAAARANGANSVAPSGNATPAVETGSSTPAGAVSSSATDDERETKRRKVEAPLAAASANGIKMEEKVTEDTPAASDEDEDDLEFENV